MRYEIRRGNACGKKNGRNAWNGKKEKNRERKVMSGTKGNRYRNATPGKTDDDICVCMILCGV